MSGIRGAPMAGFGLVPYRGPTPRVPGVLKLDGNEGDRPPSRLLQLLASRDVDILRDYPDPEPLESRLAEGLGVDRARVVVTAGADDGLDRICRAYLGPGRRLLLPVPAFEMMFRFAALARGEIETVPWGEGPFPIRSVIDRLSGDVALICLSSPNNPTGQVVTAEDLERVARAATRATVILDHAYVEYADEDLTIWATRFDNVITVRTFSKARGLAGCRVGYLIASPEQAAVLRSAGNPFPVSALSIAVAEAQLEGGEEAVREHVDRVRAHRARLLERLDCFGVHALTSQGNFVFAELGPRVDLLYYGLASLGVRIRRFPHRPEQASSLRITVPADADGLERLLDALEITLAPEALLFDLDGVLADVEGSYRRCVLETTADFGVRVTRTELQEAVLEGEASNDWRLIQRILARKGVRVSLQDVTRRYQDRYLGIGEAPGLRESEEALVSREALVSLRGRLPLGIVTGRPREEAEWFLEKVGWIGLFDAVVCMEDAPPKPDPGPVRLALSRLGVRRAWLVGDTPDDVRSARSAGILGLGIVAPGDDRARSEELLSEAGAVVVLRRIQTLEELLP